MTGPLSILHVALSGGFGGSERYCVDLAGKQQARGHRVGIVGRQPRRGANSLFDHLPGGVTAYAASRLFASRVLARAIAEQAVDVINVHLPDSARAATALSRRPPAVMTLHLRYKEQEFRKLDGMIRIAEWQEQETASYTGAAVTALNWPPALSAADPQDVAAARRLLNAAPDTFVVGFLARLHRIKRADLLIEAWRHAAPPKAVLAIIGDGPERAALETLARGDNAIRFLGHQSAMGVWHRAIDLFALPSDWEGMPLGVLEAMQLGTPILATACLGTAEALRGSHAMQVAPGDCAALVDALRAAQGKFAIGALPRQPYDLARFDPAIALGRIEDFYRRVMARAHVS